MKSPELLSPVGDFECLKAAVQNGANSVYLGAGSFNARAKATNFDNEELAKAIHYAKLRNVTVHLTLNTLIKNEEFNDAVNLAINAYNLGIDAIIVQDIGLANYLLKKYPEIPLHASTQMTVHNLDGVKQLESKGFSRVVLSRELSLEDIEYIRKNTHAELEVFIHGALCISYSGQCLLSSMIGGRSGNRGLCAQPCRLPYELFEESPENKQIKSLDKGYLLSPRDNLGIEYLPELIKMGIDSFKIEGRMKTPTYVGTVTRIYRKYIDLVLNNIDSDNKILRNMIKKELDIVNEETNLSDREELTQVFNRGGFSTGHFKPAGNKELIFKDKPNNMGICVGTISHINENKGHLKLKLENTLSIGDKVSINNESYTVSELMIDNKNFESLGKDKIVKIGRMKGKIGVGSKVYRIETAKLNKFISPTFKEDKEFKKIKLSGEIVIKRNLPISLKVSSKEGFYKDLEFTAISNNLPLEAQNTPATEERIIEQISKTGNTEFEFEKIDVILESNLFVQKSVLNELRRTALEGLENLVIKENTHDLKNIEIFNIDQKGKKEKSNLEIDKESIDRNNTVEKENNISLLFNILNLKYDYSNLENIDRLYIPLKYFFDIKYENIIKNFISKFNTYVYMPSILKDKRINNINLDAIISKFNIKGFVVSSMSQIENLSKYNLDLIGNFTLNIYNSHSIESLKEYGLSSFTVSTELDKIEINNIINNSNLKSEVIVYGKLPVMTNNYCYLGKSNKCYERCDKKCKLENIYYLKDRMNFNFRIIPDNVSTITTMYNSKILSVVINDINVDSIRIDILDEKPSEVQNIINIVKSGKRFEGKDYTNGNF